MSTFIIAFIIFALTGLSIRYYIKDLVEIVSALARSKKKCIKLITNGI